MTETERMKLIAEQVRHDTFADYLGAKFEAVEPGYGRVSLTVTEKMTNFHGTTHGGIVFGLADMAFAAASNSHGQLSVALDVTVSFLRATKPGDRLVAEAQEIEGGRRTALYALTVTEYETGEMVAKLQATVYRTKHWFVPPEE